jgi:hypothetical protein
MEMGQTKMNTQELIDNARTLVPDDKGLPAIDESNGSRIPSGNKT